MATLARRALVQAHRGLESCQPELCTSIAADDDAVDQLERQVDEWGRAVITRFQPMAGDLRRVLSAMRAAMDLECISDEAVYISRIICGYPTTTQLAETKLLAKLFTEAIELFTTAIRAYVEGDAANAYALVPRKKLLDDEHARVVATLAERIQQEPARAIDYLNLIFITRHLKRVGGHAASIAEETVFIVTARDIRHTLAGGKIKVLFVSVSNSVRSQMAEMWLKKIGGERFLAYSAGLEPGKVDPLAVEVMREVGIDMSQNTTRNVFDLYKAGEMFHYIITVCDKASAGRCPAFPGAVQRLDWDIPLPALAADTREEKLRQLREIRDAIRERVEQWCKMTGPIGREAAPSRNTA